MTERSITVSASYSRKVNLGNYESKDYWHSESRELPADSSQELVDRMRTYLMKTVVAFVEAQVEEAPQKAQDEKKATYVAPKPTKPVSVAKSAPQTPPTHCAHNDIAVCWPCKQAFKNGAVPATPPVKVPDGPDGTPFK